MRLGEGGWLVNLLRFWVWKYFKELVTVGPISPQPLQLCTFQVRLKVNVKRESRLFTTPSEISKGWLEDSDRLLWFLISMIIVHNYLANELNLEECHAFCQTIHQNMYVVWWLVTIAMVTDSKVLPCFECWDPWEYSTILHITRAKNWLPVFLVISLLPEFFLV